MNYGEKISRLRKSKGMTQEELGKVLNVTYQAVSKWERGESQPDFETMSQIAKYFQVPLNYFVDGEPEQAQTPVQEEGAQAVASSVPAPNYIGICTKCGKMLREEEVASYSPQITCKSCSEREIRAARRAEQAAVEKEKQNAAHEAYLARGKGFDARLIVSLVLTLVLYIVLTIVCFNTEGGDKGLLGIVLAIVPLAVFGCTHAIADFIGELKCGGDEPEGYTRNLSLIVAGAFAILNLVLFLVLYLSSKDAILLAGLFLGTVCSFTFVSQFLWGGAVKEIFTAGGFTFKMPGFIFSLDIDSILFMIIAKIVLGIVAVLVFVVTTVVMTLIALLGSVFLFIPSLLAKTVKDRKYKKA